MIRLIIKSFTIAAIVMLPMLGFCQTYTPDYLTIPDYTDEQQICFALYTVHNNTLKLTAQLNSSKIKNYLPGLDCSF